MRSLKRRELLPEGMHVYDRDNFPSLFSPACEQRNGDKDSF